MSVQKTLVDPIEKDDLTSAIQKLENLKHLMYNINEEFFFKYDNRNREHILFIANDYGHQKHLFDIACELLHIAIEEFHEHDIWCFEKEAF